MKVRCVKLMDAYGVSVVSSSWAAIGDVYHVLGIVFDGSAVRLRIVGREKVPALFELSMFDVVTGIIPNRWTVSSSTRGVLIVGPLAWSVEGFWERYFDGDAEAVELFEKERSDTVAADP